MKSELRNDLLAIILEESYAMREEYARDLLNGKKRPHRFDQDALDGADAIINRIVGRCSLIEG